jgi:tripartite-type tricarboxylate transporter receptor subunit TctC
MNASRSGGGTCERFRWQRRPIAGLNGLAKTSSQFCLNAGRRRRPAEKEGDFVMGKGTKLLGWFAVALAIAGSGAASGEDAGSYPSKPVTVIIPTAASVSGDILMRALANAASKHVGQSIIVDNKPGGSGALAAAHVASAKPDGYTLLNITIPIYRVPFIQKTPYDPVNDFTPIILLGGYTLGGVVKADSPFKEWKDVLEFAKVNPGRFTYTTVGPQTTNAIAMETMARHSGVQFTHVPGKGGGEGISAVLGGHVHAMVESPAWAALVASGEMRLLFLLNLERSKKWPNVPTIRELGYDYTFDSPYGLAGPKGLDPAIVKKLHDSFKKAYDDPKVIEIYDRFDFVRRYMSTEDYAKFVPKLAADERAAMERLGFARKE